MYLALVLVLVFVVLAFVVLAVMPTNLKGVDIDAERHFFRIRACIHLLPYVTFLFFIYIQLYARKKIVIIKKNNL